MRKWVILDLLIPVILSNRKGCVVEVGEGESTYVLAKHAEFYRVPLYSCDIVPDKVDRLFEGHTRFVGESLMFIKNFKDRPAVVLLDGCHDYEVLIEEVKFFLVAMVDGGVIFLHDTYPPSPRYAEKGKLCSDAYRVRQEMETWKDLVDCFTWPYTANDVGLTMAIKKPEIRAFYRQ